MADSFLTSGGRADRARATTGVYAHSAVEIATRKSHIHAVAAYGSSPTQSRRSVSSGQTLGGGR